MAKLVKAYTILYQVSLSYDETDMPVLVKLAVKLCSNVLKISLQRTTNSY